MTNLFKILALLGFFFICCNQKKEATQIVKRDIWIAFEDTTQESGWGYKDLNGNVKIKPQYTHVYSDTFSEGIAFVFEKRFDADDEKHGMIAIDRQNNFALKPFMFDMEPDELHDGLFRFFENGFIGEGGKIGFADINGLKIIPAKFDFAESFWEGKAAFCKGCKKKMYGEHWRMEGGKWGFLDKVGREIIPPQYDDVIQGFRNDTAKVVVNGQTFEINLKGEKIN
jgi:hypothetical protein